MKSRHCASRFAACVQNCQIKTKPIILAVSCLMLLGLSGCVTSFRSADAVLTTKENLERGRLVGQDTFDLQDIIGFHVDITWDDVSQEAGWCDIQWNWYKDDKLVAHYENDRAYLRAAPNPRVKLQPASSLGVGHFRVECVVNGKPIASAEFNIKDSSHT